MSLAELSRENFQRFMPEKSFRPRWVDDFRVEEVSVGEEEISVPPPIDSKILFLESAKLPNSDRFQVNIGRVLHFLRSRDVRRRILDPTENVEFDWAWTGPGGMAIVEAKLTPRPEDEQVITESA